MAIAIIDYGSGNLRSVAKALELWCKSMIASPEHVGSHRELWMMSWVPC